jgi:hypothetical protein
MGVKPHTVDDGRREMLLIYLSALDTEEDKITFESIYNEHKKAAMKAAMYVSGGNVMLSEDAGRFYPTYPIFRYS